MDIYFWVEEVYRLVGEGMSIRRACWKVKCWRNEIIDKEISKRLEIQ